MVTQKTVRICAEKIVVLVTGFYPNKCLKQIKFPISLLSCAPLSDLPFSLSTKGSRDQIPTDLQHVVCKGTPFCVIQKSTLHLNLQGYDSIARYRLYQLRSPILDINKLTRLNFVNYTDLPQKPNQIIFTELSS